MRTSAPVNSILRGNPATRCARQLSDLFDVFAALESGASIVLTSPAESDGQRFADLAPPHDGVWLGVQSSGSTGVPGVNWKPWTRLKDDAGPSVSDWVWASPFRTWTFAGVHTALQAWPSGVNPMTLNGRWAEDWDQLVGGAVTALACTPTYLNLLIQNEPIRASGTWHPRRIALGGERTTCEQAKRFRSRFCDTIFHCVYASAELGVLMKTRRLDGWFETESLERRYPQWRVRDGMLDVFDGSEWVGSGDRVEVRDRLIRVLGRGDGVANVGGIKVHLDRVSEAAASLPGVAHAQARAEPSSITGEVVTLRVQFEPGTNIPERLGTVEKRLREILPKPAWPRGYEVGRWELGENAKGKLESGNVVFDSADRVNAVCPEGATTLTTIGRAQQGASAVESPETGNSKTG